MRNALVLALALVLPMLSWVTYTVAGQITDTFDGTQIDTGKWGEIGSCYGINVSQSGALIISGTSTSAQSWGAGGWVRTAQWFPSDGIEVSVDMTGGGNYYWAGMWLSDGVNCIHFYTSRHLQPVGYTYYINGQGVYNVWLSGQPGLNYRMKYAGGRVTFLMDGKYLGAQAIPLSSVRVELSAAADRYQDSVDARFDNFSVNFVPEPSSTVALLCGVGGMTGMAWRRNRK